MPSKKSKIKPKGVDAPRASKRAKKGPSHGDKDGDQALALILEDAEARPDPITVNGHIIELPWKCAICDTKELQEEKVRAHLATEDHDLKVRAFITEHPDLDADVVAALRETITFVKPRAKVEAKSPFARAMATVMTIKKKPAPGDALVDKGLSTDDQIAALERLSNAKGLSHGASDGDRRVFLLNREECIRHEKEQTWRDIPLPCYCSFCRADLRCYDTLSAHLSSDRHKAKCRAEAELLRRQQGDYASRSSFSHAPSYSASSSGGSSASSSGGSSASSLGGRRGVDVPCNGARCKGRVRAESGSRQGRCSVCNFEQRL